MKTLNERRFYVYAYLRADGTPYYVGRGTGNRMIRQQGHAVKVPARHCVKVLQDGLTTEEADKWETDLIAILGKKREGTGCLLNWQDGGSTRTGFRHRPEFAEYMKQVHKGKKLTAEQRAAFHAGQAAMTREQRVEMGRRSAQARKVNGYSPSAETRLKMSESLKGKNTYERTPAMRANVSAALKGKKQSADTIQKRVEKLRGKKRTAEARERYRLAAIEREKTIDRSMKILKRFKASAVKYGVSVEVWISFPVNVRQALAARYYRGKRGEDLLRGYA